MLVSVRLAAQEGRDLDIVLGGVGRGQVVEVGLGLAAGHTLADPLGQGLGARALCLGSVAGKPFHHPAKARHPAGAARRLGLLCRRSRGAARGVCGVAVDGALQPGQATMQGIVAHLRAQPDGGRSIMQRNPSYVFFRELEGEGAIGALGVPVRARASVAADPAFVPLGAPVWLRAEPGAPAPLDGLWIAQDTGGAIRGANRFDSFWGAGEEAARIAGAMSARGEALVLLPKISVTRLTAPG